MKAKTRFDMSFNSYPFFDGGTIADFTLYDLAGTSTSLIFPGFALLLSSNR